jgi:hypothetical protein
MHVLLTTHYSLLVHTCASIERSCVLDDITKDDITKILRINAYIQRRLGKVTLNGEEVTVIALDRSWAGVESYDPTRFLTDDELNDLFIQSYGYTKNEGRLPYGNRGICTVLRRS